MHEVLVNRLGGLSLPRKSVVRLTDRPDMTLDVYRGRKKTMQCNNIRLLLHKEKTPSLDILKVLEYSLESLCYFSTAYTLEALVWLLQ